MEAVSLDHQPHILLAEDDFELRELLGFTLERAGYQITACDNGLHLLRQLRQSNQFDLVISDLRMPGMSGIDVLRQLQGKRLPPFICMTAFGAPLTHAASRMLGAAATIDKPFDLDTMIELVEQTLTGRPNPAPTSGVH